MNPALAIPEPVAAPPVAPPRLSPDDLAVLYARSDVRPAVCVARVVLSLTAVITVAVLIPHPIVWAVAVVLIGTLQHHCSIVHHEAVHYLLFRSRGLNEAIGSLVAFATGFSMAYRTHHLLHHRRLGEDDDPDLDAYQRYPASLRWLISDLAWHLSGGAAAQQFVVQMRRARALSPAAGRTSPGQMLGIFVTQAVLLALFAAVAHPLLYFVLWLLPLLIVAKTLAHFRGVVEHTLATLPDGTTTRWRTILCGPLERFFFAPMNFNFHAEHHFYPAIPYYRLPEAHRLLSGDPRYLQSARVDRGYLAFLLREAVVKAP